MPKAKKGTREKLGRKMKDVIEGLLRIAIS